MRIKTITCHDVYNVGASLQAYALSSYLQRLGHDVEIINYKPDYLSRHYNLTCVGNSRYDKPVLKQLYLLLKLPGRLKAKYSRRKKEYDYFTSNYLLCTKEKYQSNDELKQNPPIADVYFAGSDQIWNTVFNNGKDPAFYLDFVPEGCVKASYAASFATDDIDEKWKPKIVAWISKINYISVREKSGIDILNKLGIKGHIQVLDPVFLLNRIEWEQIEKGVVGSDRYILVYDFDRNESLKLFAKKIARELNCKIYSVLSCDYANKCFDQEGPQAFINLIHNAEFVISNSFHATAFSIIYQKQFVVFERNEKINTRMRDLLDMFNLKNRLIKSIDELTEDIIIEYALVNMELSYYIKKSKEYIACVLERGKKNSEEKSDLCN